jgi:hypothetical protein
MEGQREKTSSRRRQRRKAKNARGKVVVEPVLIAARRPDSPLLKSGFRTVVASAQPKSGASSAAANGHAQVDAIGGALGNGGEPATLGQRGQLEYDDDVAVDDVMSDGGLPSGGLSGNGSSGNGSSANGSGASSAVLSSSDLSSSAAGAGVRRRAARIVKLADNVAAPSNREQVLIDRLVSSQGRGAISRAADDLWESKITVPKRQEIQIQLLEHENEIRARDAVFAMAELLQREAPIKRPVLDQRLRRLETSAEDPITRDAAGALRRSMRVHHGLL